MQLNKNNYCQTYKNKAIPYSIWSNWDGDDIETIIFLGTVQINKMAEWVAESCPPNTVVVQGAPHWFAKSDGSDIPEYMDNFTKCAFDALLKEFPITKVHIIAESQAVPCVLSLLLKDDYRPYLKKLTLLQPLGLNSLSYQGDSKQRIKIFKRRIAANALLQVPALISDKRLRYNHSLANKIVGLTLRSPKAQSQYSSGLSYDAAPSLKKLHNHCKGITIICGSVDKIFPPAEIAATLAKNKINIKVKTVKGVPHSPLATRQGQKLLTAALE